MAKDVEKFKTSVNDVTGDLIKSKASSQKAYADNWERIFGKKQEEQTKGVISSKDTRIVLETPDGDVECVPYVQEFVEGLLPQGMIEDEQ
jgi:hypothetical protein